MARIDASLARLSALYPRSIDLSLGRVARLLERLGSPHRRLPPVIHVAGTNGKGSTIAIMRACLEAAGYRVHVYSSPHLVSFTERIRLAGVLISEPALAELIEQVEACNAEQPITVFEATTAAAFLAFASHPADILLLETGLGGRLDATNLVDHPAATVITPISMDHMAYLGDRLSLIAAEKAGIFKAGAPAVIGVQEPEAMVALEQRAREIGAPLYRFGSEWNIDIARNSWHFHGGRWSYHLPVPSLRGRHQVDNAALAVAALESLRGFAIPSDAIRRGLRAIQWPARLQRLTAGPLVDLAAEDAELWLDGGHNEGAAAALAVAVQDWTDRPLYLVFGMLNNRNPADFVRPLLPSLAGIRAVAIPGEANSHSAQAVADLLAPLLADTDITASAADSVEQAVRRITMESDRPKRILITGSLYLAGHVLSQNS